MCDIRNVKNIFLCQFPIKSEEEQKLTFDNILLFYQLCNLPICDSFLSEGSQFIRTPMALKRLNSTALGQSKLFFTNNTVSAVDHCQ